MKEIVTESGEVDSLPPLFLQFGDGERFEQHLHFHPEVVAAVYGYFRRIQYLGHSFYKLFAVTPGYVYL